MMRLGILFGGKSPEHEVSCCSAVSVMEALDKDKYDIVMIGITKKGRWLLYDGPREAISTGEWQKIAEERLTADPEKYSFAVLGAGVRQLTDMIDFAFPVMHGSFCEDGKLQGLLEMADIPYAGCGTLASAAAMDKITAKQLFIKAGLPVCRYETTDPAEWAADQDGVIRRVTESLNFPIYVKPANEGSSVGITKAKNEDELRRGIEEALHFDRRILIEEGVDAREIETGVLGNTEIRAAVTGEVVAESDDFYDYDAKYTDDGKPKMKIPAEIPQDVSEKIREIAVEAFKAIDGEGYARCDFFVDKRDGTIYINEINTIPGFTKFSMFPLLWESAGVPYSETIERIIGLGYERYNAAHNRKTDK